MFIGIVEQVGEVTEVAAGVVRVRASHGVAKRRATSYLEGRCRARRASLTTSAYCYETATRCPVRARDVGEPTFSRNHSQTPRPSG